jgi:hypothetical protein
MFLPNNVRMAATTYVIRPKPLLKTLSNFTHCAEQNLEFIDCLCVMVGFKRRYFTQLKQRLLEKECLIQQ